MLLIKSDLVPFSWTFSSKPLLLNGSSCQHRTFLLLIRWRQSPEFCEPVVHQDGLYKLRVVSRYSKVASIVTLDDQ